MLASSDPRPRGNNTRLGPSRTVARNRGVRSGARNAGTSRLAPRSARGASRGASANIVASVRGNGPQQRLPRLSDQTDVHNKAWKSSSSLDAAFRSHAGKVATSRKAAWRHPPFADPQLYNKQMNDLYQTLKQNRERERKQAIKDGFLADPDKPTTLANAITPVGICQDMCPEFERVERIVQLMVDGREKISVGDEGREKVACEDYMVKRFRRSAAGYDEQLPSDIRPPAVLQKTLDYLFNDVVGGPEPLSTVHKFVWDRTRSVRNDFSIQQLTKSEDLRIAINCFERIARFHILSLHQLSDADSNADNGEFESYQEREQLNNTLLSLQYYYDDSRHKLFSPNEAEFRAYGIIFEIQDQRPDIEDRLQNLPKNVLRDQRVKSALKLHAAAGNISDEQGPLRPRTPFSIAQANPGGFWSLVRSNLVSYLMACVAEVYFNMIRQTALEAIWKAYRGKRPGPAKMEDWRLEDLTQALGFDSEAQTRAFCEQHELLIAENSNHEHYVDLGSVMDGNLTDQNPRRKQTFSKSLVENKRLGRTFPAVINGMSASAAHAQGLVQDMIDADDVSIADSEQLFVDGDTENIETVSPRRSTSPTPRQEINNDHSKPNFAVTSSNAFDPPKSSLFPSPSLFQATSFGKPSTDPSITATQSKPMSFVGASSGLPNQVPSFQPHGGDNPKTDFHSKGQDKAEDASDEPGPSVGAFVDNNNEFPSVQTPVAKPDHFEQAPAFFPAHTTDFKDMTGLLTSTASGVPDNSPSLFDKSKGTSTAPNPSFSISPLFGNVAAGQNSKTCLPSSLSEPKRQPEKPLFADVITPNGASSSLCDFSPSKLDPVAPNSNKAQDNLGAYTNNSMTSETYETEAKPLFPAAMSSIKSPFQIKADMSPFQSRQNSTFSNSETQDLFQPHVNPGFTPSARRSRVDQQIPETMPKPTHDFQFAQKLSVPPDCADTSTRRNMANTVTTSAGPKPRTLDQLSDTIMLEDNGILQQFIEYAVEPIIKSSIAEIQDEELRQEARDYRLISLSKKYFGRWRANAWSMKLMRKGRDRRRNFARSIQDFASSTSPKQRSSGYSHDSKHASSAVSINESGSHTPIRRSPSTKPPKRQSLPSDQRYETVSSGVQTGIKRKRVETRPDTSNQTPEPAKMGHKRSQTFNSTTMSTPSRASIRRPDRSSIGSSIMDATRMKQARRLVIPGLKSDTTRTNYFRLKALGIDPDTPMVPTTKKRAQAQQGINSNCETVRPSPRDPFLAISAERPLNPDLLPDTAKSPTAANKDDDDEALFAQIHSVREALAESERWFQSERQTIERSVTPQHLRVSPHSPHGHAETPAQRNLRELQQRRQTPSRTELRLRAMGDRALLPKGFWDGEGMGLSLVKGKGKEPKVAPSDISEPHLEQRKSNGLMDFDEMPPVNGSDAWVQRTQAPQHLFENRGTSFEDAIEL